MKRYVVIEGSHTGHCCFSYSVIDSKGNTSIVFLPDEGLSTGDCLCETFERKDADQIAEALNTLERD